MPTYSSPGVYIVEVPFRPNIVPPAGAASLAIFAPFKFGPTDRAVRIANWNDFVKTYVAKFDSNGNLDWKSLFTTSPTSNTTDGKIAHAAYMIYSYFLNGGGTVYVYRNISGGLKGQVQVKVGTSTYITATAKYEGTWINGWSFEVTSSSLPRVGTGPFYNITLKDNNGTIIETFIGYSFAAEDVDKEYHYSKINSDYVSLSVSGSGSATLATGNFSGGADGSEITDVATIKQIFADLNEILIFAVPQWENSSSSVENIKTLVSGLNYAMAIVSFNTTSFDATAYANARSERVVFYYPYIVVKNPATNAEEVISPSGAIAGKYVYTDAQYNPGRVPAGTGIGSLNGVIKLAYYSSGGYVAVDKISQSVIDTNYPRHYNPIVLLPDGYYLWGARTSSFNLEWRYINKRRLLYFIEKSIKDALTWVNFENNTPATRFAVYSQINMFLYRLTTEGYFASTNPGEAYYVICDESNNPPDLVAQGYLVVDVGIAPAKPAEFVVLRFTEKTAGAQ